MKQRKELDDVFRNCTLVKSGEAFTASEILSWCRKGGAGPHTIHNARRAVERLLEQGHLRRVDTNRFAGTSRNKHWLTIPWRKRSNGAIGIQPCQFGVPV